MKYRSRIYFLIGIAPTVVGAAFFGLHTARATTTRFTQTIVAAPQVVDIVDAVGQPVEQPIVSLSPSILNAVLGTPTQKLRIMNPTRDSDWSVTIAPTGGPDALWVSAAATYDMNDLNQNDGPDVDTKGGRLTIDPSHAVVQPISGFGDCQINGLSLGSASSFDAYDPVFSSITLISGSALFSAYCGWDVTGIRLQQIVPPALPHDEYTLHLTITII